MARLRRFLPRGLYGRAALILIVPIVTIQLVVSAAFIQRHFERVTEQLTQGVALDLDFVLDHVRRLAETPAEAAALARALRITLIMPARETAPRNDARGIDDLSGRIIIRTLHRQIPEVAAVDVTRTDGNVHVRIGLPGGDVEALIPRRRLSAVNPHQLLVLMLITSILMTIIAYLFLRNQLRPISRLSRAAEAFGRGETIPYRPRGALEVRAAGRAFLEMRERIEEHAEQRMLMLSGISHDLRTPLTRMRLALAFLDDDDEAEALRRDVDQMGRLLDEFLTFVRGDATESEEPTDLEALVVDAVRDAERGATAAMATRPVTGTARPVTIKPQAVRRALDNLLGNAARFGRRVEVSLLFAPQGVTIAVEDDGPGIAPDRRAEAMKPFTRLEKERDPNRGGGVGLGLAIAADVAMAHGGRLRLLHGARLGGLRAELVLLR